VFVYTSLQERATQIAHANTARRVAEVEKTLAACLNRVVRDEARHYAFYRQVFLEVLSRDPDAALVSALAVMPLMSMPGGSMPQFRDLAEVASRSHIYGLRDYQGIVEELLAFWCITDISPCTAAGRHAQEALLGVPVRVARIAERMEARRTAKGVLL
jgi:acyl-[acyl-carrier-protein] desaturase